MYPSSSSPVVRSACLAILLATVARAAAPTPFVPAFEFPAALPATQAAAAAHGISLEGFAPVAREDSALVAGDRITALVTLLDGKVRKQWIVEATGAELSTEEIKKPPLPAITLHSKSGTEIFLGGTRAVINVRVFGPFEASRQGKDAREKRARVAVNADFLSLGIDRGCEAVLAVNAAKARNPALQGVLWSLRRQPFPPEEIAAFKKLADAIELTPARERAIAGAAPALGEFFRIISQTPGLQEIVESAIDVPWWEIIKRRGHASIGLMPQFNLAQATGAQMPLALRQSGASYTVPFLLNVAGKPALVGNLAVARPLRPLLPCAGIMAVAASAPDGKGPRVMLQVVSTRRSGDVVGSFD